MASALDDDEIHNDDYYSLLNVRREVLNAAVVRAGVCAGSRGGFSVQFLGLIFKRHPDNHM